MKLTVREMVAEDVPAACRILNDIIEIGGTTAHELPFSEAIFERAYLTGSDRICTHVVLDDAGAVAGFQWLGFHPGLPETCGDIATFTRRSPALRGAGTALFAATCAAARKRGLTMINATIRADNEPGLGYYAKMGFQDHDRRRAVPLQDGTPVDRVSKRYDLSGR